MYSHNDVPRWGSLQWFYWIMLWLLPYHFDKRYLAIILRRTQLACIIVSKPVSIFRHFKFVNILLIREDFIHMCYVIVFSYMCQKNPLYVVSSTEKGSCSSSKYNIRIQVLCCYLNIFVYNTNYEDIYGRYMILFLKVSFSNG